MISLAAGFAAVAALWWLSNQFARASAAVLARALRTVGGAALLLVAGFLLLRGRIDMAILLGGLSFGLLRKNPLSWFSRSSRTAGSVSRVRSAMIEAELDHDTGRMSGTILAGALAGRALDDLAEDALLRLHAECRRADPDGVRLLEGYLDRRFTRWREHAEADPNPGRRDGIDGAKMTKEEAYQILGLQPGADRDAVQGAHRTLMKKFHPDQGGTTYLAARINAAKDLLLSRHR